MLGYIPFRPIKAQSFRLYFSLEGIEDRSFASRGIVWRNGGIGSATWTISKDGGSPVSLTNTPVAVNGSQGYIDLTAVEMTADVIMVYGKFYSNNVSSDTTGYLSSSIIYTTSNELASIPTLNSSLAEKITALFQYFFFKRTVTDTQEELFKNDSTTSLGTNTISDDGTTVTKGKIT